jgi:voltage-gated potassium channel
MIAGVGIMFTGLIVAITIETSSKAFSMHTDPAIFQQIEQSLK